MIVSTKKLSLLVIFVSLSLVISFSAVWAKPGKTGGGGEPGAGCGFPADCKLKYFPPAYVGVVSGYYDPSTDRTYLYTPAEITQVGKSICSIDIRLEDAIYIADTGGPPVHPNDINGTCSTQPSGYSNCSDSEGWGAIEVVGAGNLIVTGDNSFTVHVVLMPLNVICP